MHSGGMPPVGAAAAAAAAAAAPAAAPAAPRSPNIKSGAPTPAARKKEGDREETNKRNKGGDDSRRSGKLTLNQALSGGEGGRQRSMAQMKRKQERQRQKQTRPDADDEEVLGVAGPVGDDRADRHAEQTRQRGLQRFSSQQAQSGDACAGADPEHDSRAQVGRRVGDHEDDARQTRVHHPRYATHLGEQTGFRLGFGHARPPRWWARNSETF